MPQPDFADAVRKVERALHHIDEFEKAADRHFSRQPTAASMQPVLRQGVHGYTIGDRIGFPNKGLALFVGDAVHNLRSALDYLITACAKANGKRQDRAEFPIVNAGGRKADLLKRLYKTDDAGPAARELVIRARPYPRGNRLIVALSELDRFDKHRLIVSVTSEVDVEVTTGPYNDLPLDRLAAKHRPGRAGFMPVRAGYEAAVAVDMSYHSEVLFARGGPLAGEPTLPNLYAMSIAVVDVIESFETEFDKLRYSRSLRSKLETRSQACS